MLIALSTLPSLKELHMRASGLHDAALSDLRLEPSAAFTQLEALDVGDNDGLSESCARRTILSRTSGDGEVVVASHMDIATAQAAKASSDRGGGGHIAVVRLVVGKHIVKEAWEIENERRDAARRAPASVIAAGAEEDNGLGLGFGKRETRVRRTADRDRETTVSTRSTTTHHDNGVAQPSLSERNSSSPRSPTIGGEGNPSKGSDLTPSRSRGAIDLLEKYYDSAKHTLALPAAVPVKTRGGSSHLRSQSLAIGNNGSTGDSEDMLIPRATFPHSIIITQPWSRTLRILKLSNRRADVSFMLSALAFDGGVNNSAVQLPSVDELGIDGCNLGSRIKLTCVREKSDVQNIEGAGGENGPSSTHAAADTGTNGSSRPRLSDLEMKEDDLLSVLHRIFPTLTCLDLSENVLTTLDGVGAMFLEGGLRVLRVRGNKLDEAALGDLVAIGSRIRDGDDDAKGNWNGVEVDLRSNEIGKVRVRIWQHGESSGTS